MGRIAERVLRQSLTNDALIFNSSRKMLKPTSQIGKSQKHTEILRDYPKKSTKELEKAIRSLNRQIKIYQDKILEFKFEASDLMHGI